VRSIGLSNFNIQLIADIMTYAEIKPAVNQVQLYPECAQEDLVLWLLHQGIVPVAWSPLVRMGSRTLTFQCLTHPYVLQLAEKYAKTPV
jgi:diketogulonate reductase-like aldo/keto reductase